MVYLVAIVAVVGLVHSVVGPGLIGLVVLIAACPAALYAVALRFRNQGATGWWALGLFVPLVNVYVVIRALAFPEGYADHRTLDVPGKVLVFLAVTMIILGVGAVLAGVDTGVGPTR